MTVWLLDLFVKIMNGGKQKTLVDKTKKDGFTMMETYILSKKLIDLGKWYDKNSGKYLQTFPWTNEIDTYSDLRVMEYIVKNLKTSYDQMKYLVIENFIDENLCNNLVSSAKS